MRSLILAAVAALAFGTAASAADTYTKDTNGRCHNAHGREVASTFCTPHRHVVCTNGKACGPTCIPRNQICRRR